MTSSAIRAALDLFHFPSRARQLRHEPLPEDTLVLLKIAAGDQEALASAIKESERPADLIKTASTFFIEQILISETHDNYRILGLSSKASTLDLKRNFSLLMRWLHPDGQPKEGQNPFLSRVTNAWNDLKTPERRAAYDFKRKQIYKAQERKKSLPIKPPPLSRSTQKKGRLRSQRSWFLSFLSALGLKI